jgi:hypothetical protein
MSKAAANDRFDVHTQNSIDMAKLVEQRLEEYWKETTKNLKTANWAHVGTMSEISEKLTDIAVTLNEVINMEKENK